MLESYNEKIVLLFGRLTGTLAKVEMSFLLIEKQNKFVVYWNESMNT